MSSIKVTIVSSDELESGPYVDVVRYKGVHNKVNYALKKGRLTNPGKCEEESDECSGRIEACHYTYDRPLLVRWLCVLHHRRWDSKRKLKPGEVYAF